ncbi:MAG: transposase [Hyphomonadaceae bacterium]|nr:transposase [Hyphomonadaceae bacterium]
MAVRQTRSKPIVDAFAKAEAEATLPSLPPRGKLAPRQCGNTLTRWDGLTQFLDDGRLELDTNPVGRAAVQPVALKPQTYPVRRIWQWEAGRWAGHRGG